MPQARLHYSTLLYSTNEYGGRGSSHTYSSLPYSTILQSALLYFTLLYSIVGVGKGAGIRNPILIYYILLYFTIFNSNLMYSTLLYFAGCTFSSLSRLRTPFAAALHAGRYDPVPYTAVTTGEF